MEGFVLEFGIVNGRKTRRGLATQRSGGDEPNSVEKIVDYFPC
jgi:hypothetical protein